MTKDEALLMALEALEYEADKGNDNAYQRERDAIKQALAAPVQEPIKPDTLSLEQLLRAAVYWGATYAKGDYHDALEGKIYQWISLRSGATPPAAQRPWVGLTPHERMMCRSYDIDTAIDKTEAKLKEKNGWYRQHVTDGSPCWCEPETSYTDPKTGASVIVHKEPQ